MNSKSVLSKILTLLSSEEVNFTDAQTADGTILQSPTFDLGEDVEVIDADGKKTPAPDGEHEIALKDSKGNEVIIRIETKDGKITSRENVEETNPELAEVEIEVEKEMEMADATTEEAHPLPNTTDEDPRNMIADDSEETEKDPLITLGYRIDEMEKQMKSMMEKFGDPSLPEVDEETPAADSELPQEGEVAMSEEEEELPKLDGAPVENGFKFSADTIHKTNNNGKVPNSQNNFLSKLYN
jgi:hypothetical protein